jgi:hypothetical protein
VSKQRCRSSMPPRKLRAFSWLFASICEESLHGATDTKSYGRGPTVLTAADGKRRRVYQRWATPLELFRNCHATTASCDPASLWPNWIVSLNCNPTPKPR